MSVTLGGKKLTGGALNGKKLKEVWLNGQMIWPEKVDDDIIQYTVQVKNLRTTNSPFDVGCGSEMVTINQNNTHNFTMVTDQENDIYAYAIKQGVGDGEPILSLTFTFPSDGHEYLIDCDGSHDNYNIPLQNGICECKITENTATISLFKTVDWTEGDIDSSNFEFRVYRKGQDGNNTNHGYFTLYVYTEAQKPSR